MATILIIDDDEPFRTLLAHSVRAAGHSALLAPDGMEGVQLCRRTKPDLVLIDMVMPHAGLAAIRVLRADFPNLRFIAMSGGGSFRLGYARDLGAALTLTKPFSTEQLHAALAETLGPDAAPTPGPDQAQAAAPAKAAPTAAPGAPSQSPTSVVRPHFVARSRFVVANGMIDEVKSAFRNRPHLVDDAQGFLRMDVISPLDRPTEIWLLTYWTDAESYRAWHKSHLYRDSHQGIPKGLKLAPGETKITEFEYVAG